MSDSLSFSASNPDNSATLTLARKSPEPDVFHCNIEQPSISCLNCFPPKTPLRPFNYVNVLDFAFYGGVSWPCCNGKAVPSRWFADIRYTLATPLPHQYPRITKNVLSSQRVSDAIRKVAAAENTSVEKISKRAVAIVNEMKAKISKIICKTIAYILFKVFRRIMSHLLVCPAQMEQVKKAQETGIPLVYLPLHRSHLDYLLLTWTVWHWGIQLPHIASGDNLNLSGLGWVLRGTGAFFIRRRIGDEQNKGTDPLYRAILNSYMTEVLRRGMPLEFFLEGTRSRFGKTLLPKNGLISSVVEAVQQGLISDVYLVPVSITYERLAEDMFFQELMGKQKTRESVWGSMKGMWQSIGPGRCGAVRMHFGVPTLLSDYLRLLKGVYGNSEQFIFHSKEATYSYRELLPWQRGNPDSSLIRALGSHIVYDAQHQASISICSAVSALLLGKYNCGGHMVSLTADLVWLCDTLVAKGFDVIGWVKGETDGEHALQRALFTIETAIRFDKNRFTIVQSHIEILRLAYYKNAILPALSITSAVALAVLSHRGSELASYSSLIETTMIICDLLQFEIIFCKPCENLQAKIAKEVTDLGEDGLELFHTEAVVENNVIRVVNEDAVSILEFFASLIKPFLYSLYLTVKYLLSLKEPFRGRDIDFIRAILAHFDKSEETSLSMQSLNSDSLNNALKLIRLKHLLEEPEIGLSNVENAHNFLLTVQHLLGSS